jgi:hypothetical protein
MILHLDNYAQLDPSYLYIDEQLEMGCLDKVNEDRPCIYFSCQCRVFGVYPMVCKKNV